MATNDQGITVQRQYIGARYVPKFFQGPDGTPAWVGNVPYEPLTIVTYLGNSYTSKIPVTPGIGNPANNPTYWALTGAYNAQVGEYQQQVQEYKQLTDQTAAGLTMETTNRENADQAESIARQTADNQLQSQINELQNKIDTDIVICIGDSYGNEPNEWCTLLQPLLQPVTSKWFFRAQGGAGFLSGASANNTFLQELQYVLENNTFDKTKVTHVIVCGGANDAAVSSGSIPEAIQMFVNYVNTELPNAVTYIGFVGWAFNGESLRGYSTKLQQYINTAQSLPKCRYLNNVEWVLHNTELMSSDMLHPNSTGSIALTNAIYQAVTTGSYDRVVEYIQTTQGFGQSTVIQSANNGVTHIWTQAPSNITLSSTPSWDGTSWNDIPATNKLALTYGDVFGTRAICLVMIQSGNSVFPAILRYSAQKWQARGNSTETGTTIRVFGLNLCFIDLE